jgi:hypothetical protein
MVIHLKKQIIMKRIFLTLITVIAIGSLFSCEPTEDRNSLPAMTLATSDLNFTAIVTGNTLVLKNLTPDVIPYWSYTNAKGDELGHSNLNEMTIAMPFAGDYTVNFSAYTKGGSVTATKIVTIAQNDASYFSAPEWALLANGTTGKTWVLDMSSPQGWAGLDYPGATGDNWSWLPDYSGNEWIMANKNWGEMSFDLNGGYNTTVKQTALNTNDQTSKTKSYTFDIANHRLIFNGGAEMLHGGNYYEDASNWANAKVIELTATSLRLAVIRDQSRTGEGVCLIVYHFKPKP